VGTGGDCLAPFPSDYRLRLALCGLRLAVFFLLASVAINAITVAAVEMIEQTEEMMSLTSSAFYPPFRGRSPTTDTIIAYV